MLGFIFLFTFISSVVSLLLVFVLLANQKVAKILSFPLILFAAGTLLAVGLTDALPEAVERDANAYINVTVFVAVFFLIERIFFHMHHHEHENGGGKAFHLPLPFLLFGDTLHNLIDGVAIASTFLVSFPAGVLTAITVLIHEIPQELGDFGIMFHMGFKRKKVLLFNVLTGASAFVGAILGYLLGSTIEGLLPILLALTAANFIYLSLSDLLPEIHHREKRENPFLHTVPFLLGILFIILLGQFFAE